MTTYAPRPIVVGLDGSQHSSHALDWAIGEATSRRLPLRLLHALHTGTTGWSPLMAPPADVDDQRRILESALHHVRTTAPDVPVTSTITPGPASVALEDASAEADTLVVGASSRGVIGSVLLGSTSLHVIGHADCPVVVVREPSDMETRAAGHVVVGFDGSHLSDDALAYAFASASHGDRWLDILIAWDTAGSSATSSRRRSPRRCAPPLTTTAMSWRPPPRRPGRRSTRTSNTPFT